MTRIRYQVQGSSPWGLTINLKFQKSLVSAGPLNRLNDKELENVFFLAIFLGSKERTISASVV
jgi:hypothetical protein